MLNKKKILRFAFFKRLNTLEYSCISESRGSYMSLGYCGKCKLIEQNDTLLRYAYSGENWNDNKSASGDIELLDGRFCIYKKCLEEPEVHIKIKRGPSKKKKTIEKRIIHIPSIQKHIENEQIIIENKCKNEFCRSHSNSAECYIAHILLHKIFMSYQKNGIVPENELFIQ